MFDSAWLRQLAQRWSALGGRCRLAGRVSAPTRRRVRPRVEELEDRLTPSGDVLAFQTSPQALLPGVASGSIVVQLKDQNNHVVQAPNGGVTINLSSSSSGGLFLSAGGTPLASPSITIPQGASSAILEYEDSQAGTPTLTASANGFAPAAQQESVAALSGLIHVTNTSDDGNGSLRAALTAANASPGSTIIFDPGVTGTIDLKSALPAITASTDIVGPGADQLTIERSASASTDFGIFTIGSTNPTPPLAVAISGLTVANGTGTGITNYGSLTVQGVVVSNNQGNSGSFLFGPPGGIGNFGTLTVLDSTIENNSTTNNLVAAGIDSEGGFVTVISSTITGNVDNNSNSAGGIGIYGGAAYIASSTISGNTATQQTGTPNNSGGGIDSDGQVTLYDTIVAGNTGSVNNPTDVSGTFVSQGYNLIGKANNQSSGFVGSDQVGTTNSPIDAKLDSPKNNGGPTPTMALLTGSLAIGTGSSTGAPATDQRGVARPQQGAIDIGAFEQTAPPASAPVITSSPTNQTVAAGADAVFIASASGAPTPTVQWQVSTDGGMSFSNLTGATGPTLTLFSVSTNMSGNKYRAVFSNSVASNINSTAATLTISATSAPTSSTPAPTPTPAPGSPPPAPSGPAGVLPANVTEVENLFQELLGRTVDTLGLDYWSVVLQSYESYFFQSFYGQGLSYQESGLLAESEATYLLVLGIESSTEFQALKQPTGTPLQVVAADYHALGLAPDSLIPAYAGYLEGGLSNQVVLAIIASDPSHVASLMA